MSNTYSAVQVRHSAARRRSDQNDQNQRRDFEVLETVKFLHVLADTTKNQMETQTTYLDRMRRKRDDIQLAGDGLLALLGSCCRILEMLALLESHPAGVAQQSSDAGTDTEGCQKDEFGIYVVEGSPTAGPL